MQWGLLNWEGTEIARPLGDSHRGDTGQRQQDETADDGPHVGSVFMDSRESHCMSYWGRKLLGLDDFQFLLFHNQADISTHGSQAFKKKFKANIRSTRSKAIYSLTFHELLKEDAGLYFCILKEKNYYSLGSVTYLRTEGLPKKCPHQLVK
ncbi:hypothetical protein JZ751_025977 [Albula glossodonta]|uniref:Immunoglobulin V-set domain-containing protein n=1 Tax=Albula glossodonta TaxID=121402 RepID=A0A8T2NEW4_9TELE|nr:hypothetical protein JZ751_025977 [Albula glossodonta]